VSREPVRYVFAFDKCPSLDALAPQVGCCQGTPGTTTIKPIQSSFPKFKFKGKKGKKKKTGKHFFPLQHLKELTSKAAERYRTLRTAPSK
jgi:hypothetical protein